MSKNHVVLTADRELVKFEQGFEFFFVVEGNTTTITTTNNYYYHY